MFRSKSAFTLAEVLITLVVIGIISALAIPALIVNIQDSQNRSAWKKAASDISQATRRLAMDNAGSLNGVFSNDNDVRDELSSYLSYVKKCDEGSAPGTDGCWNSQIYEFSGANFTYWSNVTLTNYSRLVLGNGMLVTFAIVSGDCTYSRTVKDNGCVQVGIDVNGFKGPNTVGKDIFWGYITEDGSFEAFGKQGDYWEIGSSALGCDLQENSDAIGFTCAAQYLYQ